MISPDMFQSINMLQSASSKDRKINNRMNTWCDKAKQKDELKCMQKKKLIKQIKELNENCENLKRKEKKSQDNIRKLEMKKIQQTNNQKQELYQCRQRKKELVSW